MTESGLLAGRTLTSEAVIVPATTPEAGHAGLWPPHKKTITPPLVLVAPKCMCAWVAGVLKSENDNRNVSDPSSLSSASKLPRAEENFAGTSFKGESSALK